MARIGWADSSGGTARPGDDFVHAPIWVDRRAPKLALGDLALDPIARVLATTDGTVTELLEVWAGEPIVIGHLAQHRGGLRSPIVDLDCDAGATVLQREVVLCGERTCTPLLYAESLIVLERLPLYIADGLLVSRTPIGRLLRESRLETYRELLDLRIENAGSLASSLAIRPNDIVVSRSYRVIAWGQPVMLIHEKFAGQRPTGAPRA